MATAAGGGPKASGRHPPDIASFSEDDGWGFQRGSGLARPSGSAFGHPGDHPLSAPDHHYIDQILVYRVVNGTTDPGYAVHVTGVTRAFFLGDDYLPQQSFVSWQGGITLSTATRPAAYGRALEFSGRG